MSGPQGGIPNGKRHGKYFGRPRVINSLLSQGIFRVLRARRAQQKIWNRVMGRNRIERREGALDPGAAWSRYWDLGFRKVNLGGGAKNLSGYVNIDFVPHAGVEREVVGDITRLEYIKDGSVEAVHSNHVLEHLEYADAANVISECSRILQPGGVVSLRCPNALGVCYGFFFGPTPEIGWQEFCRLGFPEDEDFAPENDGWYHQDLFALVHWLFGDSGNISNQHKMICTPTSIRGLLEQHGFTVLKISEPEASNIVAVASLTKRSS